jgi:hypothetical protein
LQPRAFIPPPTNEIARKNVAHVKVSTPEGFLPQVVSPAHSGAVEMTSHSGQPEEFSFPDAELPWPDLRRRRRGKMFRFLIFEFITLILLGGAVLLGLSHRLAEDPLTLVARIVTIASAAIVVILPIIFYGLPETLPQGRR